MDRLSRRLIQKVTEAIGGKQLKVGTVIVFRTIQSIAPDGHDLALAGRIFQDDFGGFTQKNVIPVNANHLSFAGKALTEKSRDTGSYIGNRPINIGSAIEFPENRVFPEGMKSKFTSVAIINTPFGAVLQQG